MTPGHRGTIQVQRRSVLARQKLRLCPHYFSAFFCFHDNCPLVGSASLSVLSCSYRSPRFVHQTDKPRRRDRPRQCVRSGLYWIMCIYEVQLQQNRRAVLNWRLDPPALRRSIGRGQNCSRATVGIELRHGVHFWPHLLAADAQLPAVTFAGGWYG